MLFDNIPLPPSENQLFGNSKKRGIGRFKTKKYKDWEDALVLWYCINKSLVHEARTILGPLILSDPLQQIELGITICVTQSTIFTKDRRRKRFDCHNRIKPLLDGISRLLEIDDRFFSIKYCRPQLSHLPKVILEVTNASIVY